MCFATRTRSVADPQKNFVYRAYDSDGTSCHIHYPWELQHTYQFAVALIAEDTENTTWEGSVTDLTTQVRTVIGDISVSSARGYFKRDNDAK